MGGRAAGLGDDAEDPGRVQGGGFRGGEVRGDEDRGAVEGAFLAPTFASGPAGVPLAFGGVLSAAIATFVFRGNKWLKLAVLVGIALLGSLEATWMLHSVYGTLSGSFTAGLAGLLGAGGIGTGAVLTIFLSNPLSGVTTGPWLLPAGWSTLGAVDAHRCDRLPGVLAVLLRRAGHRPRVVDPGAVDWCRRGAACL